MMICNQSMGVMIVEFAGTSMENDLDWCVMMELHCGILLLGWLEVDVEAATSLIVIRPLAARMAGIMVRRDHGKTGAPFHSAANQRKLCRGIASRSREISFSLTDSGERGTGNGRSQVSAS